jgi:hypothetical protein
MNAGCYNAMHDGLLRRIQRSFILKSMRAASSLLKFERNFTYKDRIELKKPSGIAHCTPLVHIGRVHRNDVIGHRRALLSFDCFH